MKNLFAVLMLMVSMAPLGQASAASRSPAPCSSDLEGDRLEDASSIELAGKGKDGDKDEEKEEDFA